MTSEESPPGTRREITGASGSGVSAGVSEADRLRTALAAMGALLRTADATGEVTAEQTDWAAFTGQTFEQYRGIGWADALHPDDAETVLREWRAAVSEGRIYAGEQRVRRHDGEYRLFTARALPVRDGDGAAREWVSVHTDVTDARRNEDALRESEARFRLITDLMPQLVWSTLPDGYHDLYNRRWYEYVGADFERSLGEGWSTFLHPDDFERAWKVWQHSLDTGAPYEIEYRFKRHDGAYRWFIGRALPLRDETGRITRWFGTCTDIDDQKRAEETLLRQQGEIAQLNHRLRQAMVETHHRVKNNLQMISALIEIQRDAGASVPAEVLDNLSRSVRALGVIHDILTREAKGDGEADALSAKALLEQLVEAHAATVPWRRVTAIVEDARLRGREATSVALVANEYLANALKHGADGDVEVAFQARDGQATLRVRDHGPGFPAGFSPSASANTGLELIEAMVAWELGGQATYENAPDGGAVVTVVFPLQREGREDRR
jgi:PAS domain S-box-containing protein